MGIFSIKMPRQIINAVIFTLLENIICKQLKLGVYP